MCVSLHRLLFGKSLLLIAKGQLHRSSLCFVLDLAALLALAGIFLFSFLLLLSGRLVIGGLIALLGFSGRAGMD